MKALYIITLIIAFSLKGIGQTTKIQRSVDSLIYVDNSFGFECNSVYWKIIKMGIDAVPLLIQKLPDTTQTEVYNPCLGKEYNVGEISYMILDEIMPLPLFEVTQIQFDVLDQDCLVGFSEYFRVHQSEMGLLVNRWYRKNMYSIAWQNYEEVDLNYCQKVNGIAGYYKIK